MHDLLRGLAGAGYDGTNEFTDGFLDLQFDGTNTTVRIDADGSGGGGASTNLVVLNNVRLESTVTDNLVL